MTPTPEQTAGAAIGGLLGFIKSLTLISSLSWAAVADTAVLSGVGTVVGLAITTIYKYIKSKLKS